MFCFVCNLCFQEQSNFLNNFKQLESCVAVDLCTVIMTGVHRCPSCSHLLRKRLNLAYFSCNSASKQGTYVPFFFQSACDIFLEEKNPAYTQNFCVDVEFLWKKINVNSKQPVLQEAIFFKLNLILTIFLQGILKYDFFCFITCLTYYAINTSHKIYVSCDGVAMVIYLLFK